MTEDKNNQKVRLEDLSRKTWIIPTSIQDTWFTNSALLRIANALEKSAAATETMAQSKYLLEKDVQYYKDRAEYWKREHAEMQKQISIYKGLATRAKNELIKFKHEKSSNPS